MNAGDSFLTYSFSIQFKTRFIILTKFIIICERLFNGDSLSKKGCGVLLYQICFLVAHAWVVVA